MRKKSVFALLICIVLVSAIPTRAADILNCSFNTRDPQPFNPGHYWPDPNIWDRGYDNPYTAWFDVCSDWFNPQIDPCDPNQWWIDPNNWFMVLGQWGQNYTSDAWITTHEYQDVNGLLYVDVKLKGRLEVYGNPLILLEVGFWDNITNLTPKGVVTKVIIDPNVPTTRLAWANYELIIPVPTGAGIAKFTVRNDSAPIPQEGTVHLDNFVVSDVVCMDRPLLDVTGDCKVGLADLAELSAEWLSCGKVIQADCW
jgi:hypothetical protein